MFLINARRFVLLAVFGLLVFSRTAAAQDIASGGITIDKSELSKLLIEKSAVSGSLISDDVGKADESSVNQSSIEFSATDHRAEIKNIKYQFRTVRASERQLDFEDAAGVDAKKSALLEDYTARRDDDEPRYIRDTERGRGFNYRGAFAQSLLFLAVQHGYALTQPKTRESLKGKFWADYADSVKSLHGWDDGGRFFTNYLAHPMQGAFTGHVYVQNSPQALREQFSMSGKYWETRMKALLWTTAWSTQFELGPISQASIGNVGLKGKQTWEDIIVTPTAGTAMLIGEDAIDRYFIKGIARRSDNLYVKVFSRILLNPTRNFSNLLRFREPWYRDRPTAR